MEPEPVVGGLLKRFELRVLLGRRLRAGTQALDSCGQLVGSIAVGGAGGR